MAAGVGIAESLGKMARDAGSYLTEKLRASDTGSQIHSTLFSQDSELARSPEGMKVKARLQDYDMKRNQILNNLIKEPAQIQEVVKNDPVLTQAPIGKIHADLVAKNHPVAAATGKIITSDPTNANLTLDAYNQKLWGQARLAARAATAGENNANIIGDIMPLYETGSPVDEAHANAILSIVSNQFHDSTRDLSLVKGVGAATGPAVHSEVKLDMRKALLLENKFRDATNQKLLNTDLKNFDTMNVHEKTNAIERFTSWRARIFLAPMIAVNHMSTFFNFSQAPLEAIYKGMASMGDQEVKQLSDAAAVLGSQHYQMLTSDIKGSKNFIAAKTGMPEVGRLYNQIFHNPGFNFVRESQLKFGAAVGYHAAQYWADGVMKGDKRALLELKEMKINPAEVIKNQGQLTRDQKIQAIWHFVNNRSFISRPLDRSLTSTRNPWTRMLTMFHGYVTFQQRFMRRELQKMLDAGDYKGIAQFAGTVGLMFPTVAPMIKGAEVLARTASPSQAAQGLEQDYETLSHPENVGEFTAEYIDMLSYFGSWGTMHSFITAAHGDRLALALMGPIAGSGVRAAQDTINLATKSTKSGKHNIKPLAKDVLQQTLPGAGNIIANQIFPAKTINN